MEDQNINKLVAKYLSGNASEREKQKIEAWRKEGNEALFKELDSVWNLSMAAKPNYEPDTEKGWNRFKNAVKDSTDQKAAKRFKLYYSLAAAAALVPFILFIFLSPSAAERQENFVSAVTNNLIQTEEPVIMPVDPSELTNIVSTGDSLQEFYLPDGSRIVLNKNSKFTYTGDFVADRTVKLEGEAFFEVKRDPEHPFIIYTPTSITKVLGTSFNLRAYEGKEVEITVMKGKVEFAALKDPEKTKRILTANEKARLNAKTATTSSAKAEDVSKEVVWKKGPKSQTRFKRFLNKIKKIFKKKEKDKIDTATAKFD